MLHNSDRIRVKQNLNFEDCQIQIKENLNVGEFKYARIGTSQNWNVKLMQNVRFLITC